MENESDNTNKSFWDRPSIGKMVEEALTSTYNRDFIHGVFVGILVSILAYRIK